MRTLVGRLADNDPVVRLTAHEELRRRTGLDFGYVPWANDGDTPLPVRQLAGLGGTGHGESTAFGAVARCAQPTRKFLPAGSPEVPAQ